jgi:hypothetical protein
MRIAYCFFLIYEIILNGRLVTPGAAQVVVRSNG